MIYRKSAVHKEYVGVEKAPEFSDMKLSQAKEIRDYERRVIDGIVLFTFSTADAKREAEKILQKFYEKVMRVLTTMIDPMLNEFVFHSKEKLEGII